MIEFNPKIILFALQQCEQMGVPICVMLTEEQVQTIEHTVLNLFEDSDRHRIGGFIASSKDENIEYFDKVSIKKNCVLFDTNWKRVEPSHTYIFTNKKIESKIELALKDIDIDDFVVLIQNDIEYYTHINNLQRTTPPNS